MADFSTYKNLELPKSNERYNVAVANKNNMVIDSELHKLDIKNQSQDDLLAATKEELNSEILRAAAKETEISGKLNSEISRATDAESKMQENLSKHISNESNPHKVTKSQLGLGNVDNTSDSEKFVKGVIDYGDGTGKIQIGYSGSGITANDNLDYLAGYCTDNGMRSIKDVTWLVVQSKLGLDQKVSKSGDTMTGELHIEKSSGDTFLRTKRTDTKHELLFGVGSGGYNRGIHDTALDKWILWLDSANKAHFIGDSQTLEGKSASDFLPAPTKLTTQDLNSTTTPGFYYGAGGNTVKNKPDGIAEFGLLVIRTADSYRMQYLYDKGEKYYRSYQSNTWSNWTKDEAESSGNWFSNQKLEANNWEVDMQSENTMEIGRRVVSSSKMHPLIELTSDNNINLIAEAIKVYYDISAESPYIYTTKGGNFHANFQDFSVATANGSFKIAKENNTGLTASINNFPINFSTVGNDAKDINLTSGRKISLKSNKDKTEIYATEIRLIPQEHSATDTSPSAGKYVKTGNIQGIKFSDGSKPGISNFGRIGCEKLDCEFVAAGEMTCNNTATFDRVISYGDISSESQISSLGNISTQSGMYSTGEGDLGQSSRKWNNIYATNGTIVTSDRNEKDNVASLTDELTQKFIMGLNPSSYQMKSGTSGRTHWGLISQDIEELMETLGMDSMDFGGFIKSPKTVTVEEEEEYEEKDENGETVIKTKKVEKEQAVEGEYIYSLRYDEFIAPIIKMMQMQQTQIASQDKKISDLEAQVEKLNALVLGKGGNERENYGTI
ncbi:MAG: pyocin knob domain-containing S74 family peptidase [Lachnoclostridium sp.]|nr:pyocin knob domain-containing S74 family peptidase [Lachnospira sp.]MCM1247622.1 pyocin knob domain-containing S74 family peptidase [Lachnoclostridium sp.]